MASVHVVRGADARGFAAGPRAAAASKRQTPSHCELRGGVRRAAEPADLPAEGIACLPAEHHLLSPHAGIMFASRSPQK